MNLIQTSEFDEPNIQDERTKLLNVLASKIAAASNPEKNLSPENAELAKYTGLNCEIDLKQPRNEPETDMKYSNSEAQLAKEENVKLDELPLPLQSQILEILDSSTYDAATESRFQFAEKKAANFKPLPAYGAVDSLGVLP